MVSKYDLSILHVPEKCNGLLKARDLATGSVVGAYSDWRITPVKLKTSLRIHTLLVKANTLLPRNFSHRSISMNSPRSCYQGGRSPRSGHTPGMFRIAYCRLGRVEVHVAPLMRSQHDKATSTTLA